jgi:hypothetical protein
MCCGLTVGKLSAFMDQSILILDGNRLDFSTVWSAAASSE